MLQNAGERCEDHVGCQKHDNKWKKIAPGPEWQRQNKEQIYRWSNCDEDDLEKPNTWQTKPTQCAIFSVKDHVTMFPQTLQGAIGPAESLTRKRPHRFRRLRPRYGARNINGGQPLLVQA